MNDVITVMGSIMFEEELEQLKAADDFKAELHKIMSEMDADTTLSLFVLLMSKVTPLNSLMTPDDAQCVAALEVFTELAPSKLPTLPEPFASKAKRIYNAAACLLSARQTFKTL